MRRIAKPNTIIPAAAEEKQHSDLSSELPEFDIDALLTKSGEILRREVSNLMSQSSKGKLGAAESRDLVAYIKLLTELRIEKQKEIANLTDEELEALTAHDKQS